jgi:glutamate-ammonia-ligase adenylyltransferase
MTGALASRLRDALAGTPLAERLAVAAEPLVERRSGDAAARRLAGGALDGLARVVATRPEVAGFLSHRPALLARIAEADPASLGARVRELEAEAGTPDAAAPDLEHALDALRILRREETCLAAVLDLGSVVPFEEASLFLSALAEAITRRALGLALRAPSGEPSLAVIGLGKIAGREFTYHSDLDLVFLHAGGVEALADAARVGQRLIAYLATMTGAGVAYAVDTRLRPSGRQGSLVTSLDAFERYQTEQAQTWEHLALLRARAVAGCVHEGQATLDRVRSRVLSAPAKPWAYLAGLRKRVHAERARESATSAAIKTGPGGLMDVDFLAEGGLLERGAERPPPLPSIPALLRAALAAARVEALARDYAFLRLVESRARWLAGRAVEAVDLSEPSGRLLAELVEPGLAAPALASRIAEARARVAAAFDAVVAAGTIRALAS